MFNEKRSELLRVAIILSLMALTIGVVLVLSANNPSASQVSEPIFINASANHTINFTVTNPAGSTEIDAVRIQKPGDFSTIDCGVDLPPGWSCDDTSSTLQIDFSTTGTGIAAGSSVSFMINGLAPASSGNQTFTLTAFEGSIGDGTQNGTLKSNVTVDADAPLIFTVNVSDTNATLDSSSLTDAGNHWVKLANLGFNVTITDVFDNIINASVYLNISNSSTPQAPATVMPHPDNAGSYSDVVTLTSPDPATGRYNGTLASTDLVNGTVVYFVVVANDSVSNTNLSNNTDASITVSAYNFTVDGQAPLVSFNEDFFAGFSDAVGYNLSPSTTDVNLSVKVDDSSGSGVHFVTVSSSDDGTEIPLNLTNSNGDGDWNFTGPLSGLGVTAGDHKMTLTFRAYDNVGQVNNTITLDVEVDDDAPQFTGLATNYSNNYTSANSTQLNITFTVNGNLNTTHNVTIHGPNDQVFNASWNVITASEGSGQTANGTSTWFTVKLNSTNGLNAEDDLNYTLSFSNWTQYGCPQGAGGTDGQVCQLQLNATDIFGRVNSSNISITLDNLDPFVVNISNNATSDSVQVVRDGMSVNLTLNAENNIDNVTVHNSTTGGDLSNATTLVSIGGTNFSIALDPALVCGGHEGTCTVNFTATDLALNTNRSVPASTSFIVDNSAPIIPNENSEIKVESTGGNAYINQSGSGIPMTTRTDVKLNVSFNVTDQVTNVTQVNLGNATLRNASLMVETSSYYVNDTTLADFGCPSGDIEGVSCILAFDAFDNLSIDNLANVNNTVNLTFYVDNLKPRVEDFSTDRQVSHVVTSVDDQVNFSVNITEANLPALNATIGNSSSKPLNKSGASTNTTAATFHTVASVMELGCELDSAGSCIVTVTATDASGNVNDSITLTVQVNNATFRINNLTGSTGTRAVMVSSRPVIHVNTSAPAQCRYSTAGQLVYADMETQFGTQNARHNSFTIASDLRDDDYDYNVACVDADGNNESAATARFSIDTTSLWNVTIGKNGYNGGTGLSSYFSEANKFYQFQMDNTILTGDAPYLSSTTVNVTDVLARIVSDNPSGSDNNLSILYAINSTDGTVTSFIPGRASGNTLNNFTADGLTYYANMSVANERIEIT